VGFAQFTEVYAYGFRGRELESIDVSPVCKFIETLLEVTLDNMDMLRSVADQKTTSTGINYTQYKSQ